MQSQLDNTDTSQTTWTEQEIKELILYAKSLQEQVDDVNAKLIMMNAKLEREEMKVIRLTNMINFLTNGAGNNA